MNENEALAYLQKIYPQYTDKLAKVKIVQDTTNFTDPKTNEIHWDGKNSEFLVHEYGHAIGNDTPITKLYEPYAYNDKNFDPGQWYADMNFINRTGDPREFYDKSELTNRVRGAKFKTQGQNYSPEFFMNARNNETQYGDNMRDLLHMFDDNTLSKIFSIEKYSKGKRLIKRTHG